MHVVVGGFYHFQTFFSPLRLMFSHHSFVCGCYAMSLTEIREGDFCSDIFTNISGNSKIIEITHEMKCASHVMQVVYVTLSMFINFFNNHILLKLPTLIIMQLVLLICDSRFKKR